MHLLKKKGISMVNYFKIIVFSVDICELSFTDSGLMWLLKFTL